MKGPIGSLFMKIAICDDEAIFRKELKKHIDNYAKAKHLDIICDDFSNGHQLISSKNSYDVIFMDHQMDDITGLETAKKLRENNNNTDIIFLTSYPHIVFDTFSVNTFRFLVKPIDDEKLFEALDELRKSKEDEKYLIIKIDEVIKTIPTSDIIYVEASDKYCYIRTVDDNYLYKKTLSDLEKQLPEDSFFRCHRTYLVNMKHVISHTSNSVTFINNEKAVISKTRLSAFKKSFVDYIKQHNI